MLDPLRIYKVLKRKEKERHRNVGLTLYEFTRFSNRRRSPERRLRGLTLYEFTRFSNFFSDIYAMLNAWPFTNLQGSQTEPVQIFVQAIAWPFTNLQGSQTGHADHPPGCLAWPFTNLQGSQTWNLVGDHQFRLDPLRIYKVLKQASEIKLPHVGLTLYEFTRFSNRRMLHMFQTHAWPFTNLQGSQTVATSSFSTTRLDPLRIYKVLKRNSLDLERHLVLDPLRIYKVLKQIDYLKRFRSKLDPLRIYKVLKLLMFFVDKQTGLTLYEFTRFSNCLELLSHEISLDPLRIYKVLKPCGLLERFSFCLTLYEFTRFSNKPCR